MWVGLLQLVAYKYLNCIFRAEAVQSDCLLVMFIIIYHDNVVINLVVFDY